MSMLTRIKKRQFDGFKEFVVNMETTPREVRGQILTTGILEDPLFMSFVLKNIRTFEDILKLEEEEIEAIVTSQDTLVPLFAKAVYGHLDLPHIETLIPKFRSRFREEYSYLQSVSSQDIEGAKNYFLKLMRKLQSEEKISGPRWLFPPEDAFYQKQYPDGLCRIYFESGTLAAEGEYLKGKRVGPWKHNYDNGSLFAEGDYLEGFKEGVWEFYFGNGQLKSSGKYRTDLRHGAWTEYDRSGASVETYYKEGARVKEN